MFSLALVTKKKQRQSWASIYLLRYIVHELVFVGKQRKIKLKILSISSDK